MVTRNRGWPAHGSPFASGEMYTMRQLATALAAFCIGLAAAGCSITTNGSPTPAGHAGPLAALPVAEETLDGSLLTPTEINAVMAAAGMTVHTSRRDMWDDSPHVADDNCLAVDGPAEDKIYAGSGWTAMRTSTTTCPWSRILRGCPRGRIRQLRSARPRWSCSRLDPREGQTLRRGRLKLEEPAN